MREATMLGTAILIAAMAGGGCQDRADLEEAKRSPKPPPPESAEVPQALSIVVEIDGMAGTPIDHARLASVRPDWSDDERKAWKLSTLLGDAASRPGAVVAVSGGSGPEVLLRVPASDEDPQPALLFSRRAEVVATMVSPQEPFPGYHGRGGRLGRSGDPVPRIVGVRKIRVYLER